MLKFTNQIIVFLIELIMFGAFAYFSYQKGNGAIEKYVFAIISVIPAIIVWAYWAAPKSDYRIKMPYLALFRLSLFLLASFLLYKCKLTSFAFILAFFSIVTQVASLFLESDE